MRKTGNWLTRTLFILFALPTLVHAEQNGVSQILENNGHAAADFLSLIKVFTELISRNPSSGTIRMFWIHGPDMETLNNLL